MLNIWDAIQKMLGWLQNQGHVTKSQREQMGSDYDTMEYAIKSYERAVAYMREQKQMKQQYDDHQRTIRQKMKLNLAQVEQERIRVLVTSSPRPGSAQQKLATQRLQMRPHWRLFSGDCQNAFYDPEAHEDIRRPGSARPPKGTAKAKPPPQPRSVRPASTFPSLGPS